MLITTEGIEGCGKSSQIRFISEYLSKKNIDHITTREPGGTEIGAKIRAILLNPEHTYLSKTTELMLYAADRSQHMEQIIRPALNAGKVVISDRFCDSTWVFQGFVRGNDMNLINRLDDIVLDGLEPDITFLLDVPVEVGLGRARGDISSGTRNNNESRFENENMTFHQKVRDGYLQRAREEHHRFIIIDASKSIEGVTKQILDELDRYLDKTIL